MKATGDELKGKRVVITGNEISCVEPGLSGRQSFKLNPEKMPKEIDLTILDGKRKGITERGIYEIEGQTLRLCVGRDRRPKRLVTTPGSGVMVLTLQKEPARNEPPAARGKEAGGSNPKSVLATGVPASDMQELQGEWEASQVERSGEKVPAESSKHYSMAFEGNRLVITTNVDQGKVGFRIDPGQSPKRIDMTTADGPLEGKTLAGIGGVGGEPVLVPVGAGHRGRPLRIGTSRGK